MKHSVNIFLFAAVLILMGSCSSPNDSNKKNDNGKGTDPTYVTLSIGPAGDTLQQAGGATLIIPAGALNSTTTISLKTFRTSAEYANGLASNKISPIESVVELLPDGLHLNVPAKLIIPLERTLSDSSENLVLLRNSNGSWQVQRNTGMCQSGGTEVALDITHFCSYGSTGLSYGGLDAFRSTFESTSGNGDAACSALQSGVMSWNGDVFSIRKKVGEDVYQVCGVNFDAMWQYGSNDGQKIWTVGTTTSDYTIINDAYDYMSNSTQIIYSLTVTLYWKKLELQKFEVTLNFTASGSDIGGDISLSSYSLQSKFIVAIDTSVKDGSYFYCDDEGVSFGETDGYSSGDPNYPKVELKESSQSGGNIAIISEPDMEIRNLHWGSNNIVTELYGQILPNGSTGIAFFSDPIVSFDIYGYDDEKESWVFVMSIEGGFFISALTEEAPLSDNGLKFDLRDGYTGNGTGLMIIGLLFQFNGTYTVQVHELPPGSPKISSNSPVYRNPSGKDRLLRTIRDLKLPGKSQKISFLKR